MNYYAFGLGGQELLILLLILLLLFGSTRLPKLAKSIGTSIRELRRGAEDVSMDNVRPDAMRLEAKTSDSTAKT
jgi:sec-independent protein translocase protein TatA